MAAIIERMSGRSPEHSRLKIVENDDLDRPPLASETSSHEMSVRPAEGPPSLCRVDVSTAYPLPTDFGVSTYGQIWISTEARTILGSDSWGASHHIGVPKTSEEERHGEWHEAGTDAHIDSNPFGWFSRGGERLVDRRGGGGRAAIRAGGGESSDGGRLRG